MISSRDKLFFKREYGMNIIIIIKMMNSSRDKLFFKREYGMHIIIIITIPGVPNKLNHTYLKTNYVFFRMQVQLTFKINNIDCIKKTLCIDLFIYFYKFMHLFF